MRIAKGTLTAKQMKFVDSYLAQGDKVKAVIYAGYPSKTAQSVSCQLLKHPNVIAKITEIKALVAKNELKEGLIPAKEFRREDFIAYALKDYEALDITEPNKPRFLHLAGQGAGIIGVAEQKGATTINNLTQVNINGSESQPDLWGMTRKLLESQ